MGSATFKEQRTAASCSAFIWEYPFTSWRSCRTVRGSRNCCVSVLDEAANFCTRFKPVSIVDVRWFDWGEVIDVSPSSMSSTAPVERTVFERLGRQQTVKLKHSYSGTRIVVTPPVLALLYRDSTAWSPMFLFPFALTRPVCAVFNWQRSGCLTSALRIKRGGFRHFAQWYVSYRICYGRSTCRRADGIIAV